MQPILLIHGGAGNKESYYKERIEGISTALEEGNIILKSGGSAVDCVGKTVISMEDNPIFNAGYGSVPGLDGEVEMDAALMTMDGRFGAVAAIKRVKNPIQVARKVMEETEHLLIVGEGATKFARVMGFYDFDPLTKEMKKRYNESKETSYYKKVEYFRELYGLGTVGAIAMDRNGEFAVATSTGGLFLHLPGRVGDTPILGGGTYASNIGAASATGHGEEIARNLIAKVAVDMLSNYSPQKVVEKLLDRFNFSFGIIIMNKYGEYSAGYSTKYMARGLIKGKNKEVDFE